MGEGGVARIMSFRGGGFRKNGEFSGRWDGNWDAKRGTTCVVRGDEIWIWLCAGYVCT